MYEPRGHADMYGAIVTEPTTLDGDLGVLFMHNEGWSTMCGHGIIALVTVALETGMLPRSDVIRLDTPAGRVTARPRLNGDRVISVAFENVPSYAYVLDEVANVPRLGHIQYDIGFGGAFYAFVHAVDVGVELVPQDYRKLIEYGTIIKKAIMSSREITHPAEPELSFLYGTIFYGHALSPEAHKRQVCVFADGEVDRSPTGTGVSALLALEIARGNLRLGAPLVVESIIGSRFTGTALQSVKFDKYEAIIPQVEGSAWVTGRSEFVVSPDDPMRDGFILR